MQLQDIVNGGMRDITEIRLKMAQEIDRRELERAKLIVQARPLEEGLAKYGRI